MKYVTTIGFAMTEEVESGLVVESISKKRYMCEVTRVSRRLSEANKVNGELTLGNQFSVAMDAFLSQNFFNMRYIEFMGAKWTVTNVEVQRPRVIITTGGVYGQDEESETESPGIPEDS